MTLVSSCHMLLRGAPAGFASVRNKARPPSCSSHAAPGRSGAQGTMGDTFSLVPDGNPCCTTSTFEKRPCLPKPHGKAHLGQGWRLASPRGSATSCFNTPARDLDPPRNRQQDARHGPAARSSPAGAAAARCLFTLYFTVGLRLMPRVCPLLTSISMMLPSVCP